MRAGLLSAAATLWLSLGAAFGVPADHQGPAGPKPFLHSNHVPEAWSFAQNPEVWRDCRGCHRFDSERLVSAPQQECDSCHAGQGKLVRSFDAGFVVDLAGNHTRTAQAFRHHTHGMLECRQCHAPRSEGVVPDNLPIRTGPGFCAECHEAGRADVAALRFFGGAEGFVPPQAGQSGDYAQKLVAVFGGEKGGMNNPLLPAGVEFDHADHLVGFQCIDCHTGIETATATQIGVATVPADACKKCHLGDARGTTLQPLPARKVQRPLSSLGAFAHGDHFGWKKGQRKKDVCSEQAYAQLEKGDGACALCHTYTPASANRGGDFPFAPGASKHLYSDCIICHDGKGWQTGETAVAPLHDSTKLGGGWKACTSCHVFGGDLAETRPTVAVQRFAERTFVFPANVHPDITTKGIVQAGEQGRAAIADCTKCHRAKVPELPTRLQKKVFRHDSHLPATPGPEHCSECHPAAVTATGSAQLAGDAGRTYSLGSCKKCHWGGEVTEMVAAGEVPATRAVVEFSHAAHVGTGKLGCAECHTLGTDGRDVATKAEALACNQCHDHDAGNGGPKAEGLFGDAVQSCARCHHEDGADAAAAPKLAVPAIRGSAAAAKDPRYRVEQALFGGFAGGQFHPATGKCTECHRGNVTAGTDRIAAVVVPVGDHLRASATGSVHGPGPREPAACLRCHWMPAGKWLDAVRGAAGTREEKALRLAPASTETRAKFGNDREGYPGTEKARG